MFSSPSKDCNAIDQHGYSRLMNSIVERDKELFDDLMCDRRIDVHYNNGKPKNNCALNVALRLLIKEVARATALEEKDRCWLMAYFMHELLNEGAIPTDEMMDTICDVHHTFENLTLMQESTRVVPLLTHMQCVHMQAKNDEIALLRAKLGMSATEPVQSTLAREPHSSETVQSQSDSASSSSNHSAGGRVRFTTFPATPPKPPTPTKPPVPSKPAAPVPSKHLKPPKS